VPHRLGGIVCIPNESMNLLQTICLTQGKDHFSRLTRSQRHFCRHCRAGIKAGARTAGQPDAPQSGGVETEPCSPRNSVRSAVTDWVGEPQARRRSSSRSRRPTHSAPISLRSLDRTHRRLERSVFTDGSKNPFGVVRCRQTPGPIAIISHVRHTNLIGSSVATKTKRSW
jgi:hypothetical protein